MTSTQTFPQPPSSGLAPSRPLRQGFRVFSGSTASDSSGLNYRIIISDDRYIILIAAVLISSEAAAFLKSCSSFLALLPAPNSHHFTFAFEWTPTPRNRFTTASSLHPLTERQHRDVVTTNTRGPQPPCTSTTIALLRIAFILEPLMVFPTPCRSSRRP